MLGCPTTIKVLDTRKELAIPGVQDKILEVSLMIRLKLLPGVADNVTTEWF